MNFRRRRACQGETAMSILNKLKLDKLKKITHREPEIRDFCIQTIRFKKFLENARAMLDLFEDGREKALGEYIFDRHYVVSLIDSVIERLGMMVYDACVLVPKSGEDLYAGYDRHKLAAANLINWKGPAGKTGESETAILSEPEYQLLSDALFWLTGKDATDAETVMGFMKQTFFHVIQGLESTDAVKNRTLFETSNVKATDMGLYLIDLWKDALALPETKRAARDCNSVPLKHLLMDAGGGESKIGDGNRQGDPDWVALVTEYQLSLKSLKPDLEFRLETLASNDAQSDFIFIFAGQSANLNKLLPAGFHIEKTRYGHLAWNLDMSAKTIEDSLMTIGRGVFS
jgi:hypothetical protein